MNRYEKYLKQQESVPPSLAVKCSLLGKMVLFWGDRPLVRSAGMPKYAAGWTVVYD